MTDLKKRDLEDSSNKIRLINNSENSNLQEEEPKKEKVRLVSLDVYRGLTITGMILVNLQGSTLPNTKVWPLDETSWDGLSPADCIFPAFLFIVGMAIPLSLRREQRNQASVWLRILKRSVILFLIELYMNLQIANFDFETMRIMNVLQRIAICYLIVSTTFLLTKHDYQIIIVMVCFAAFYLGFIYGYNVPNFEYDGQLYECGRGVLNQYCNFGAYSDREILGINHLYIHAKTYDPEGLFTTTSAVLNTFFGLIFSLIMKKFKTEPDQLVAKWLFLGLTLIVSGIILDCWVPICKRMWSISFAIITSGFSGLVLNFCYIVIDNVKSQRINDFVMPLVYLGMNPLIIYTLMEWWYFTAVYNIMRSSQGGFWQYITDNALNSWINNMMLCSLIIAIFYWIVWSQVARILYKKNWFIRL